MAGVNTVSTQRTFPSLTRGKSTTFNRCISSNIIMVHGEDGKAAVVAKQSTFSTVDGPFGSMNITRVEERCSGRSLDIDDNSSTSSDCTSDSSSSTLSTDTSECRSPLPPVFHVRSSYARTSHDALRKALHELRWEEQVKPDGTYDFYWHGIAYEDCSHEHVTDVHAINKLPGMLEISHKVQLSRILKRMQNLYPDEFDFYPTSWVIPDQFHQFIAEAGASTIKNGCSGQQGRRPSTPARERNYIIKPDQGRQGDGIYLVTDPRDVRAEVGTKPCIAQRYIDKPLLLEGYKFDLRIYVVIARLDPIEIYMCKEGLARLCTAPYEVPNKQNVKNTFMHLTNYSLNKNSENFIQTDAAGTGSKRTLTSVEEVLSNKGYDVRKMRRELKQLSVKTILAILPDLTIWSHASGTLKFTRCFQILGFDVILSSDMKAYLLEVNAVPSLRIDAEREVEPGSGIFESIVSAVDEQVKVNLIKDTLELVALGEENVDMQASCLKRIYPTKNPSDPPRNFREFQQRIRLCDRSCIEQNLHRNILTPGSLLSQRSGDLRSSDEALQRRHSPWFCNRHCPHCHTTMSHKKPALISEKEEQPISSKYQYSGAKLQLLKPQRQPATKYVKFKPEPCVAESAVELHSPNEDQPYKQCPNCGGYLNDAVGPGILMQRMLLQNRLDSTALLLDPAVSRFKPHENPACIGVRGFKLAPTHCLPRYNLQKHEAFDRKGRKHSPNNHFAVADERCCHDTREIRTPKIFGKRTSEERVKQLSFYGYHVMLLRKCAKIFIYFNGIKASLTMGATSFRNMARKCNLCEQGALPSIDILYIDALRQWQSYKEAHGTPLYIHDSDRKDLRTKKQRLRQAAGLTFQGFVDALVRIAAQRYRGDILRDKMEQLVSECERYIAGANKTEKEEKMRLKTRGGTLLSPWAQQTVANRRESNEDRKSITRRWRYTSQ